MRSKKKSKINKKLTRRQKGGQIKNKLVVKLSDGLSNRLFQIMAGLAFAERWNMDLFLLNSGGNHVSPEISKSNILQLIPSVQFIDDSTDFTSYTNLSESQQFVYNDIPNPNNNAILSGYFQTDKYFPKTPVKLNLVRPVTNLLENLDTSKLFFIHFRYGDYNNNGFKLNLDTYYKICIKKIKEQFNDAIFIIVSNSKDEAKTYIETHLTEISNNTIIYDNDTNERRLDSLYYMSKCKGGICTNSTFSWLGAYCIENKGLIFMPSPWLSWVTGKNDIYPTWATVIDINQQLGGQQSTKLIITNGPTLGGFFSEFVKMLAYLEANPSTREIEYNILATPPGEGLPFINKGEELFSKVFLPYNENVPIDNIVTAYKFEYEQYTYRDAYNNYNENHYKLQGLHDAFVKYIHVKQEILDRVNSKYNEIKDGYDTLVGIFVRSAASADEQPNRTLPTRDDYMKAVNNLDKSKKIKYFLRIDNNDDLDFYKTALTPNYYSEMKRSSNNQLDSLHITGTEYMSLQDLEDILVDILLLSKCDILIHCVSNMATTSLAINMEQQSICVSNPPVTGGSNNIELTFSNTIEQRSGMSSLLNQLTTFLVDNPTVVKINYNIVSFTQGHPMAYISEGEELFSKLFNTYDENKEIDTTIINNRYEDQRITGINAYNYYNENRNKLQPFHDAYVKYVKINSDLQEKIDSKVKELKGDSEQIIAIFIRSNALAGEQPSGRMPTREEYDNAINYIDKSKKTKYFFCIDNNDDLEYFKNKYNPNYYTNIRRITNKSNGEPHTNTLGTLQDLQDSFIEVVLLSSCDIMIHCVSNMATASLYMNMNQKSICISGQQGGDKQTAYVINLEKRPKKWERIQNDFKDTNIYLERFKAIEHENGHVGCGESFKALIRMAKEQNMDSILILEDDCKPLKNFNSRWVKIKEWLDTNKDKWNIFNGGVRYPLNANYKYEIDNYNKFFTTKGGNYTHFMYFNSAGYDAVLNWEHSKDGLFDYYINSYEHGNFLYIEPAIAIQYSGFSNTNMGEKNYEINGWVANQKSKTNALPNNIIGGKGKNRKTRKRKTKKGGNSSTIPFVFVHLGEEFFPEWIEYAFKQCRLWNPDNTIYFLCSKVHLPKFDNTLVTYIDVNSINKTEHHKQYDVDVPLDNGFRNGFYRYTTERIFVLEDFSIQYKINEFIHLENDHMVFFSANDLQDIFRNSVNGLSAPVANRNEICFGILYSNNINILSNLTKYLLFEKSGSEKNNGDMMYGLKFFRNNINDTAYLPSIPIINDNLSDEDKKLVSQNIDKYKGVFDQTQYGVWLSGEDTRNPTAIGPYKQTKITDIITADKFTYELHKESNNLQRYHMLHKEKNIDLPIYVMHVHSKKLQDFYFPIQNGGKRRTRKIKKQKGGDNEDESHCIYLDIHGIQKWIASLNNPAIIYMNSHDINSFIIPANNFTLVTATTDNTVPDDYQDKSNEILNSSNLIHWFSQNLTKQDNPKLSPIPIGLDYHTIAQYKSGYEWWGEKQTPVQQEKFLIDLEKPPYDQREIKIYCNFYNTVRGRYGEKDRRDALDQIPQELFIIERDNVTRKDSWTKMSTIAFVASPLGNGLDCHRTWEALALGCIPIIKTSIMDSSLFNELPVLIVNEWSDINEQLLKDTINSFKNKTFNMDKLKLKYWKDIIIGL